MQVYAIHQQYRLLDDPLGVFRMLLQWIFPKTEHFELMCVYTHTFLYTEDI